MTTEKLSLGEMIDEASKLPPGPEAWAPIFEAYPEITPEQLIDKFQAAAERDMREAAALEEYMRSKFGDEPGDVRAVVPCPFRQQC